MRASQLMRINGECMHAMQSAELLKLQLCVPLEHTQLEHSHT